MQDIHIILGAPKKDSIRPLIQSDGLVIGVDRGALYAINEEIKVDIALGDFDSITIEEDNLIKKEATTDIITAPAEKDDTDAELAFNYILKNYNVDNIYVYNWYGGRIDHLYSLLLLVLQPRFEELVSKIKYISANNVVNYYLPGEYEVKKIKRMKYLSYILLTEVEGLTLENVKYELNEQDIGFPMSLISNEFLSETASFSFKEGVIAVVQSRDGD